MVGAGYVGLVAACGLANSGHQVTRVEKDPARLSCLREGKVPFREEGLDELLHKAVGMGRLSFAAELTGAPPADITMVAVGTPSLPSGKVDLSQVQEVVAGVAAMVTEPVLLVMKSTVPPGTGAKLQERFLSKARVPIRYVSNPEFLREGRAVYDWYHPDRIVIGADDPTVVEQVKALYADIEAPVIHMDVASAEMTKYAANAFLATKISFINEIAHLCELVGADVLFVANAVGLDPRIGPHFLQAGLGYGGSCFPKDTSGLDFIASMNGHQFNLLKAVIEVNQRQRLEAARKLAAALGGLADKEIAVLGLAFKPGTGDVREAPAIDIIRLLLDEGARVRAYDPAAMEYARRVLPPDVTYTSTALQALDDAHATVVATEWPEFITLDWEAASHHMQPPRVVLDGRNCLPIEKLLACGLVYVGIGRRVQVREY